MRRLDPVYLQSLRSRLATRVGGLRDESGNILLEMAMIFAFLGIPMLWGTSQMSILVYDSIEVSNAANAGAVYGAQTPGEAISTAAIATAAQAEASDFPRASMGNSALTVTSNIFYYCANAIGGANPQYTTTTAATAACGAAGSTNETVEFVQVNTSATVTPLLRFPGVRSSYPIVGQSILAVQQ
jgi:Flp pilus assembly protein TadG